MVQPIRSAFVAQGDRPLETTGRVSPFYALGAPLARLEFMEAAAVGFELKQRRQINLVDQHERRSPYSMVLPNRYR
ncbi:hypothetical protein [Bradyrhizobium sp. NBAIM01]|uniref:hypothetical protein n=1 Tax=Bradyrhizobium sp. NBAIM01 TaxID=2793818 RepID=UPI001CD20018|nr:hypothetical protein [Bradyrhizobium sp. NBAIM01]